MKRFKIMREIPEIFEVDAESYDEALDKISDGLVEDSVPLCDRYELVEESEVPAQDAALAKPARKVRVELLFETTASEKAVSDRIHWLVNDYMLRDVRGWEYYDMPIDDGFMVVITERRDKVVELLEEVRMLDADQFQAVVAGCAIAARQCFDQNGDVPWGAAATHLANAVEAIGRRSGN